MIATAKADTATMQTTQKAGIDGFLSLLMPSFGRTASRPDGAATSIAGFFDYWLNLPRPGGMPDASAFAPAAVVSWLPEVILFELNSPSVATYRLAGTAVVERLGHNPTGSNLLELLPPERRPQSSRNLYELFRRPCGLHLRYVNAYSSGFIGAMESLYLPLRPPAGGPPRIVAMNAPSKTLSFEDYRPQTTVVTEVSTITWIDVGYGTPGGVQPRP